MPIEVVFTNPKFYNSGMNTTLCVCENPDCKIPYGTCHCGCGRETRIQDQKSSSGKGRYKWPRLWCAGHNCRASWNEEVCVCGFPECSVPYGLCHCGCGQKTRIAAMTQLSKRWRRDEPMMFLAGHAIRGKKYAKKPPNQIRNEVIDGIPCVWLLLTKGQWTVLWEEDYEKVKPYRWWFQPNGYAYTTLPSGKSIGMHMIIMNPPEGSLVDHKDGGRLDNRRDKLQIATVQENHYNLSVGRRNKTGWRGISKIKSGFRTRITVDGKEIPLGVFTELKDAVEARKRAEEKYYGPFRRTG